jgi:hypothetical protein
MGSSDPGVPAWEHASLFAIDAANGRPVARRSLPDPVPVAALVLEGRRIHAVATRAGELVYWYALTAPELRPVHRLAAPIADSTNADVLDAWALSDGGLWLEVETGEGLGGYVSLSEGTRDTAAVLGELPTSRDACESGRSLFVPLDRDGEGTKDALARLDPERAPTVERRARPRKITWGRVDPELDPCRSHALAAEGLVYAAAFGGGGRGILAQVIALDRTTGVERWKTPATRFAVSETVGGATRLAYASGEVVMQRLAADGTPCSDLLFAGPRGSFDTATLGARRRFVLDASLGPCLLAHATKTDGRVLVAGFSAEGRGLLGRRAQMQFSVETPDVGGAPAVYAGAGKILVKGARRLVAIAV